MDHLTPDFEDLLAGLDEEFDVPRAEEPRRIWPHGYSVRVRLSLPRGAALEALQRLDWTMDPQRSRWTPATLKGGVRRWTLRGSTFLTQRRPNNKRLPMTKFNSAWKVCLYSLQVELHPEATYLDIHGVRHDDIQRVLEGSMKLRKDQYEIAYYRALERFFVIEPHEAHRLAVALDGRSQQGRGRLARKEWLLREYKVPVRIRSRTVRTAELSIYRVTRGATGRYKCEIRLSGKARHRDQFRAEDAAVLDAVLQGLIDTHGLNIVEKPARWHPRGPERWRRDPLLRRLGQKVYRGHLPSVGLQKVVEKCHTPGLVILDNSAANTVDSVNPQHIRSSIHSPGHQEVSPHGHREAHHGHQDPPQDPRDPLQEHQEDPGLLDQEDSPSRPPPGYPDGQGSKTQPKTPTRTKKEAPMWNALVTDLLRYEDFLSEVVLDDTHDPGPMLETLVRRAPEGSVAMMVLCMGDEQGHASTWTSVSELAARHPATLRTSTLVLVVDPSVVCVVSDAVSTYDPVTGKSACGPLLHPSDLDVFAKHIEAVGLRFFGMMKELRQVCEQGLRVVVVSADARPLHGRGPLRSSHYFRDGRVRSLLGDAGRYNAHLRYLIQVDAHTRGRRVVMVKDEGEGLMGRIIWARPDSWGLDE